MRIAPVDADLEQTPAVRIVPMRRRHLRAVLEIDRQVYPRPWSMSLYQGELDQPEQRRVYLVARAGRQVLGHAGLTFAADQGHVTTVAVDPAWQGRGVGTRLLLVLFRAAIAGGATSLTLEVRAGNTSAQQLYRRFGFVEAGVRAGYYAESGEDAVIMWAHETASVGYHALLDRVEAGLRGPRLIDEVRPALERRRR
jgi:[ribosomal protein S18]-alanine N-acetyltransferase